MRCLSDCKNLQHRIAGAGTQRPPARFRTLHNRGQCRTNVWGNMPRRDACIFQLQTKIIAVIGDCSGPTRHVKGRPILQFDIQQLSSPLIANIMAEDE